MNAIAQVELVEVSESNDAGRDDSAIVQLNELELAFVGGGTGDVCF